MLPLALWRGRRSFSSEASFYEIKHVSFLVSEVVGILGGVLLMLLGARIALAAKLAGRRSTLIRT